jgi:DNA modification methylase
MIAPSTITPRYALYNGDCVEIMRQLPSACIDFSIFSPPFANLYIYSDDLRDMGNCKDTAEFFVQHGFMTEQLMRILKPGRLAAVHCKQLARYKGRDGASGWQDFRGDLIRHFESYGFQYHSEVVIWTDPVLEMQKTKTQRLLYCQLQRDASLTGIGMPEYLLLFRKWPREDESHEPIRHYRTPEEAASDGADERQVMDLDIWQRYASPVWFDIRRTDVLNARIARDDQDEKHICPLQLEVIRRAVQLWSNPNEVVFSPFGGIGSEPYIALEQGRRAVAIELKAAYYQQMTKNCESICDKQSQGTLLDFMRSE